MFAAGLLVTCSRVCYGSMGGWLADGGCGGGGDGLPMDAEWM